MSSRKENKKKRTVLDGDKKFDVRKILVRDYRIIARRLNLFMLLLIAFFAVTSVYLLVTNMMLRKDMDNRLFVQVDNKIYEAVKTEQITENVARGFTNLGFAYLFNHDEYNYLANLETAKHFFRRKSYNYIVSRFNTKSESTEGLTLFEMYQTYDARMSFEITEFKFQASGLYCYIEGDMRYVFEAQEPKTSHAKFQFQLEVVSKSKENPYGLKIKGLKPVK